MIHSLAGATQRVTLATPATQARQATECSELPVRRLRHRCALDFIGLTMTRSPVSASPRLMLVSLAAAAAVFAGCGGGADPAAPGTEAATTMPAATVSAAAEPAA